MLTAAIPMHVNSCVLTRTRSRTRTRQSKKMLGLSVQGALTNSISVRYEPINILLSVYGLYMYGIPFR